MRLIRLVPLAALVCMLIGGAASSVAVGRHSVASPLEQARRDGIDLGRVIETVSHHVAPTKRGTLVARDGLYRTEFDASGFEFRLRGSRFRLTTVSVNGAEISPGPWRGRLNRAERELEPGITERVTARDGTVEWDVVLTAVPRGARDLELSARVDASGVPRTGKDVSWSLGKGRVVRMGELVVKDARGRTLHRALPHATRGRVDLRVPREAVERATYPITIDPVISPEYRVTEPSSSPARDDEEAPVLAFDGTNYLVVWQKYFLVGGTVDIYGARVSRAGAVLDSGGIAISTAPRNQLYPEVAFDGTNYLVVWEDRRSAGEWDLYGARVSTAGAVLDPGGIAISTVPEPQWNPSVAFDGTNYLVVWEDLRSPLNPDVYGTRVSRAGAVLDAGGIAIASTIDDQLIPSVAFDGTNYLVVWQDDRFTNDTDVYGARVSTSGVVLDSGGIAISTAPSFQSVPKIDYGGTDYLVAWDDSRAGPLYTDIYGARVSTAGTVRDPGGIAISTAPDSQNFPSVASDGTNFLIAWEDSRSGADDVYGARVSQAGAVLDPGGIAISTAADYQSAPSVAFDGTNYLVAWKDWRSDRTWDVYGARVSTTGAVHDPQGILISTAVNDQFFPSVAFDGTNYLVVWQDLGSGSTYDVFAARVTESGTLLDGAGIAISTAAGDQDDASVAFDGTNFLVVWHDTRTFDIYGARVSQEGVVLDPGGIRITSAAYEQAAPSVAFDGTNFLVAWLDFRSGLGRDVYAARVSAAGAVLDPSGIAISTATGNQSQPSIAFDGTNYLVAWNDSRSGTYWDIYCARVSQAGAVLDPGGIAISTAADDQLYPNAAFDGTNFFVVWEDDRSGIDVYGARVSQAGDVLDPNGIPISTATYSQWAPSVAFDGTNHVVAWQDFRSGSYEIYSARITPGGVVLDAGGILVATTGYSWAAPSVTRGGPGRTAIAYVRRALEPPYGGAFRVFLRFFDEIGPPPPPAPPPPPPPVPPQPPPPPRPPPPPPAVRCRVPRVIGLRLAAARTRIRRNNCSVGRIRRVRSRRSLRGRVLGQRPRPRAVKRRGFPVNLLVGRR